MDVEPGLVLPAEVLVAFQVLGAVAVHHPGARGPVAAVAAYVGGAPEARLRAPALRVDGEAQVAEPEGGQGPGVQHGQGVRARGVAHEEVVGVHVAVPAEGREALQRGAHLPHELRGQSAAAPQVRRAAGHRRARLERGEHLLLRRGGLAPQPLVQLLARQARQGHAHVPLALLPGLLVLVHAARVAAGQARAGRTCAERPLLELQQHVRLEEGLLQGRVAPAAHVLERHLALPQRRPALALGAGAGAQHLCKPDHAVGAAAQHLRTAQPVRPNVHVHSGLQHLRRQAQRKPRS
mmetsp:Transcript_82522/g.256632  ORF Transcript_82522/g.256632 Transcript_82522/m.256632 type:complete len:294 (+) Transcript_82522:640-1521(+)